MSWGWSSTTKITGLAFCVALFLFIAITKSSPHTCSTSTLPEFGAAHTKKAPANAIMRTRSFQQS
jgi:hypothetical protein